MRLSHALCLALVGAAAARARDIQPRRQLKQIDGAQLRLALLGARQYSWTDCRGPAFSATDPAGGGR